MISARKAFQSQTRHPYPRDTGRVVSEDASRRPARGPANKQHTQLARNTDAPRASRSHEKEKESLLLSSVCISKSEIFRAAYDTLKYEMYAKSRLRVPSEDLNCREEFERDVFSIVNLLYMKHRKQTQAQLVAAHAVGTRPSSAAGGASHQLRGQQQQQPTMLNCAGCGGRNILILPAQEGRVCDDCGTVCNSKFISELPSYGTQVEEHFCNEVSNERVKEGKAIIDFLSGMCNVPTGTLRSAKILYCNYVRDTNYHHPRSAAVAALFCEYHHMFIDTASVSASAVSPVPSFQCTTCHNMFSTRKDIRYHAPCSREERCYAIPCSAHGFVVDKFQKRRK